MKRLAFFVSGSGSDMQSVLDGIAAGEIDALPVAVVASRPGIYALERAAAAGVPGYVFEKGNYPDLSAMYAEIVALLQGLKVDYVILAGYLTILTPNIIAAFKDRIVNIHPSLIPSFCGKGFYGLRVHRAALDYGVKVTGATVHFVDEGADTGAIIAQRPVEVLPDDTPESLQARVLKTEHELLPEVVKRLCAEEVEIVGRQVHFKAAAGAGGSRQ